MWTSIPSARSSLPGSLSDSLVGASRRGGAIGDRRSWSIDPPQGDRETREIVPTRRCRSGGQGICNLTRAKLVEIAQLAPTATWPSTGRSTRFSRLVIKLRHNRSGISEVKGNNDSSHEYVCWRSCKGIIGHGAFFQHPRKGLHSVEELPMLAVRVGAFGNPGPTYPGFGCLSGVCGCRVERH